MQDFIDKVLPPKYHTLAVAIVLLSPYLTRAWHALMTGGGLRGVFSAIWLGTNTPTALKAQVAITAEQTGTTIITKPVETQ